MKQIYPDGGCSVLPFRVYSRSLFVSIRGCFPLGKGVMEIWSIGLVKPRGAA
jgi:hypothetical protein